MIAWALVVYGVALVITSSTLFAPLRRLIGSLHPMLDKLVGCMMCVGFWWGFFLSLVVDAGISRFLPGAIPDNNRWAMRSVRAVLDGAAASGLCWVMRVVMVKLGEDEL